MNYYETYRLTLEHYINDNENHINIEEPLIVQMIIDRTYAPTPVCVNHMLDMMKDEVLKRVGRDKQ